MIRARHQAVSGESQSVGNEEQGTFETKLGHEPVKQRSPRKLGKPGRKGEVQRARGSENGTAQTKTGQPPKKTVIVRKSYDPLKEARLRSFLQRESRELERATKRHLPPKPRSKPEEWLDSETIKRNMGHSAQAAAASEQTQTCAPAEPHVAEPTVALDDLTPQLLQEKKNLALTAILCGETYTEAAKAAGVDRRTIHRWRQEPEFQAEFQRVKGVMDNSMRIRLAALTDDAVAAIKERMEQGHVPTAIHLLQSVGVLDGRPLTTVDGLDEEQVPGATPGAEEAVASPPDVEMGGAGSGPTPAAEEVVDLWVLPVNQQQAIGALLEGKMLVEAAGQAHVTLRTLQRWMRSEGRFRQVLRGCRQEQIERTRSKLQDCCLRAVDVMVLAVKYNRNATASFALLRGLGLIK